MKTFAALVALVAALITFTAFSPVATAQSFKDNVSVTAGVTRVSEGNTVVGGSVEVQKTLGTPKLVLDNTFSFTDNVGSNTGQVLSNNALLRGNIGDYFFVAGGASFGTSINTGFDESVFLNPTLQSGVTFNVGERLQFEPFAQLTLPDVLSDNPTRALTGTLTTKVALADNYGLKFDVGISQVRVDNRFFKSNSQNVPFAFGGMYFNF